MSEAASRFYNAIKDAVTLEQKELVGLFAYYLTVEAGENVATSKSIDGCFTACDVAPPSRTAQIVTDRCELVGPLTIELTHQLPIL
jgi:hypothetical protein